MVSETWLYEGPALEKLREDCLNKWGLSMLLRCRKRRSTSNPGGGVGVIFDPKLVKFVPFNVVNRGHELLCVKGKVPKNTRPLFVLAAYLQPKLCAEKTKEFLECIDDAVLKIKSLHTNPYIVLAGDFNHRNLDGVLDDYDDLSPVVTCLLYTSPSPRDRQKSRMPSSA